ncbi:hypothetical protein TELCIR_15709, partial [Teladorsagia circumcincta]
MGFVHEDENGVVIIESLEHPPNCTEFRIVRKELKKVDVKMTVKFLYPHLNRGDLYTKQGILCMLQAGIK